MGWHGFARMLTEVVGSLRDVLLPRGCAGCDMPDAVLCDDCHASGGGFTSFAMPGTVSAGRLPAAHIAGHCAVRYCDGRIMATRNAMARSPI